VFALAKKGFLFFFDTEQYRAEFAAAMRPVAKGLVGAFSAGTPEVLPRFERYLSGHFYSNLWFFHVCRFIVLISKFDLLYYKQRRVHIVIKSEDEEVYNQFIVPDVTGVSG
jgi:hypothetical protein